MPRQLWDSNSRRPFQELAAVLPIGRSFKYLTVFQDLKVKVPFPCQHYPQPKSHATSGKYEKRDVTNLDPTCFMLNSTEHEIYHAHKC